MGLIDTYLDLDFFAGTGSLDFMVGALVKFNILPDFDNQIGLATLMGLKLIQDSDGNQGVIHLSVLTSKRFPIKKFGVATPYAAIKADSIIKTGADGVPITATIGSKLAPKVLKDWTFYVESSINLNDSYSGLSAGVSYLF